MSEENTRLEFCDKAGFTPDVLAKSNRIQNAIEKIFDECDLKDIRVLSHIAHLAIHELECEYILRKRE